MLKRFYSLILIVFLLASCAHQSAEKSTAAPLTYKSTKESRNVGAFNQVDVKGQVNVSLHTGYKKPEIVLSGDPRDLAQVKAVVSDSTLYFVLGKGFPHHGAVSVEIRGQFLNSFKYQGSGIVRGMQLHTSVLDLYLANTGSTQLGGSIGLRKLEIKGSGVTSISGISSQNLQIHLKGNPTVQLVGVANIANLALDGKPSLSLYWVKSDSLIIRAKKAAKIQLAGTVNRLDVELWGYALFKGRYLRAQRSFVRTHGHSIAEISSVNHQSTLATDMSNIYYFNIPNTRADFMAYDGSVLDMREWDQFDMEDFNRYNKQFP